MKFQSHCMRNFALQVFFVMLVSLNGFAQDQVCDVTKSNGGGFTTTIQSVICNNTNNTHTIVLSVEHNGCGGNLCKALTCYAIQAVPGTYSNVSVQVISGTMTYSNISMGPDLGGSIPFQGFKIDGTQGIGNGQAGMFTVTYTLTGGLQAQQTSAKANLMLQIASFNVTDFITVMNCYNTGCNGGNPTGPDAINDNCSTVINTQVNINVLANDIAGSGTLVASSVAFVAGTAPSVTIGVFTKNNSGVVTFTPALNYSGTATINYQVCDINAFCDVATITVTISAPGNDSDGDGCPDDVDDYPNDPTRCFDNYFPATGNGTLAFEDLWPGQGDYDFNDLVCDYRFKTVTNSSNKIVEIFGTFTIKAFGASLHNGFGFQFPNNIIQSGDMTITGFDLQEGYISLNAQGLETGQNKPTVIVFDDVFNLMKAPGVGIGVNTTPGAPYVTPASVTVHMIFPTPKYTMNQVNLSNFNPFLIVGLNRGIEVHLPDYLPTGLASADYFGKAQDRSIPSQGRYYRTENNLPWAINICQNFAYPKETIDIVNTYNHFVPWAISGGLSFPDWYMDKPGYRNAENVYQP